MDFGEYERRSAETDIRPDPDDIPYPVLGLAGEVGEVAAAFKKYQRDGGNLAELRDVMVEELGDVLWYLAATARTLGATLDEIAERNLQKTGSTWCRPLGPAPYFDAEFAADERLPRQFTASFVESADGRAVRLVVDGVDVGDWIDDNAVVDDSYRYHDTIHLAFAAVLGWSPVLRKLLHRKRKSDPEVDRTQDGARAMVIEEALAAFLFSEADLSNRFQSTSDVDWEVVRVLQRATRGLEVNISSPEAWRLAVTQGFHVWDQLSRSGPSRILVDMEKRSLVVHTL